MASVRALIKDLPARSSSPPGDPNIDSIFHSFLPWVEKVSSRARVSATSAKNADNQERLAFGPLAYRHASFARLKRLLVIMTSWESSDG